MQRFLSAGDRWWQMTDDAKLTKYKLRFLS